MHSNERAMAILRNTEEKTPGIKGQLEIWVDKLMLEVKMCARTVRRPNTEPKEPLQYIERIYWAIQSIPKRPRAPYCTPGWNMELQILQLYLGKLFDKLDSEPPTPNNQPDSNALPPRAVKALENIWAIVKGSGSTVSGPSNTCVIVRMESVHINNTGPDKNISQLLGVPGTPYRRTKGRDTHDQIRRPQESNVRVVQW